MEAPSILDFDAFRLRESRYNVAVPALRMGRVPSTILNGPFTLVSQVPGAALFGHSAENNGFLWVFPYANKLYEEIIENLKEGRAKVKAFHFADNEWIFYPDTWIK